MSSLDSRIYVPFLIGDQAGRSPPPPNYRCNEWAYALAETISPPPLLFFPPPFVFSFSLMKLNFSAHFFSSPPPFSRFSFKCAPASYGIGADSFFSSMTAFFFFVFFAFVFFFRRCYPDSSEGGSFSIPPVLISIVCLFFFFLTSPRVVGLSLMTVHFPSSILSFLTYSFFPFSPPRSSVRVRNTSSLKLSNLICYFLRPLFFWMRPSYSAIPSLSAPP